MLLVFWVFITFKLRSYNNRQAFMANIDHLNMEYIGEIGAFII